MTTWERVWLAIAIVTAVVLVGPFMAFASAPTPLSSFAADHQLTHGSVGWYPVGTPVPYKITEDTAIATSTLRTGEKALRRASSRAVYLTDTQSGESVYWYWTNHPATEAGLASVTAHAFTGKWVNGRIDPSESDECSGVIYSVQWDRYHGYPEIPIPVSMWDDNSVWKWGLDGNVLVAETLKTTQDKWPSTYPTNNYRGLRGSFRHGGIDIRRSPAESVPRGKQGFATIQRCLVLGERTPSGWDMSAKMWGASVFLGSTLDTTYTVVSWSVVGPELQPNFVVGGTYQTYPFDLSTGNVNPATDAQIGAAFSAVGLDASGGQELRQEEAVSMATARFHTAAEAREAWSLIKLGGARVNFEATRTASGPGVPDAPDVEDGGALAAVRQFGDTVSDAVSDWLWFLDPWSRLDGGN